MMIPQTLSEHLTALSQRETPPPWHELAPILATAARFTEHVSGCTVEGCGAFTEAPDPFGRCLAHMIACDHCGEALETPEDGETTAGGRLLCVVCVGELDSDRFDVRPVAHEREVRT